MLFTVGSEEDRRCFIQRALDRYATDGSGLNAVVERCTGKPVGMIGLLSPVVDGADELEIGHHLLPSACGKRSASGSAMACKDPAREYRCAHPRISVIDHENFAGQAVAKRNGMTHEKDTVHRGIPAMVWRVVL